MNEGNLGSRSRGNIDTELMKRSVTHYLEPPSWIVAIAMIGAPSWVPYPGIYRARRGRKQLHVMLEVFNRPGEAKNGRSQ